MFHFRNEGFFLHHYLYNLPGKNSWKQYIVSIILILFFLSVGSILYVYSNLQFGGKSVYLDESTAEFINISPTMDLLFSHLINLGEFIGIFIAIRFIHKRKLVSLITFTNRVDWNQVLYGFSLFFILNILFKFLDFIIHPHSYAINQVELREYLLLFFIVLLFVPLQTTVEELIFRGFLLQWFAKKISHPFLLSLVVAVIFGSLHFTNPEMEKSALWVGLNYIWGGFMLTFLAVKIGRSELSIGAHAANNMFILWFLAEENSTDGSVPALFKIVDAHPATTFIWNICIFLIFYFFINKKYSSFKQRSDYNVIGRHSHS